MVRIQPAADRSWSGAWFRDSSRAFTVTELLVAMAVFSIILLVLLGATDQMTSIWKSSISKIEQFREGRRAFEAMTRRIGSATLNPYLDYRYDSSQIPTKYIRNSDLRFLSAPAKDILGPVSIYPGHGIFFQAPIGYVSDRAQYGGLEHLVNTWGYFVEYAAVDDPVDPANVSHRFRLVELREPSENLSVYRYTRGNNSYTGREWITVPAGDAKNRRILADDVIVLILQPKDPKPPETVLAPGYTYDSSSGSSDSRLNPKNQLPPVVDITMVILDKTSASRICTSGTPPDLGLTGLFDNPDKYTDDMAELEKKLVGLHLRYQIFRASIPLTSARWSTLQTD